MKFVYLIRCDFTGHYKIGIANNPNKRLKQLQTAQSSKLTLMDKYQSKFASKIETNLHNLLRHYKLDGEWFDLSIKEVAEFNKMCEKADKNFNFLQNYCEID